VPRVKDAITR